LHIGTPQLSGHPQDEHVNNNNNNNNNNASKKLNISRFEHWNTTTLRPPAGETCKQQLTKAARKKPEHRKK